MNVFSIPVEKRTKILTDLIARDVVMDLDLARTNLLNKEEIKLVKDVVKNIITTHRVVNLFLDEYFEEIKKILNKEENE